MVARVSPMAAPAQDKVEVGESSSTFSISIILTMYQGSSPLLLAMFTYFFLVFLHSHRYTA